MRCRLFALAAALLPLAAPPAAFASPCAPTPEKTLAAGLLGQLPPDLQSQRAAAVNATLAACPGTVETFFSSLMSWNYLLDRQAEPAMVGMPVGQAGTSVGSGRAWGGVCGELPFVIQGIQYEGRGELYTSPLLLDLNGNGVPDVAGNHWEPHAGLIPGGPFAAFDIDGDGWTDVTEWMTSGDALLVAGAPLLPVVPDPRSGRFLFGTAEGFAGGFAKLAYHFDLDHDGVIVGAEMAGLYLWQDADGDAEADPGEVVSPIALGIESLSLPPAAGCVGSFSRGAATGAMWDWWPSYVSVNKVAGAVEPPVSVPLDPQPIEDLSHIGPAFYAGPEWLIPSSALAAAGFDLASGRLVGVSPDGRWYVLTDAATDPAEIDAGRARRIWILDSWSTIGWWVSPRIVPAPVVDVLQFEFESEASALVVADEGSRLLQLDLQTGALRSLYAPLVGQPRFRASNCLLRADGCSYVSGNFCAADGSAGPEQFARVELSGAPRLVAEGNLDAMRAAVGTLGTILQELPVSPRLAYFVVRTPEGQYLLVSHRDGVVAARDTCVAPVGLAADAERVLCFSGCSSEVEGKVHDVGSGTAYALGTGPYCYPYLGATGSRAIVTSFDWPNAQMTLWSAPVGSGAAFTSLLTSGIGAVRLSEDGLSIGCLAPEGLYLRRSGAVDAPAVPGRHPAVLRLYPARPNPSAGGTTIRFDLPAAAQARVEVFTVDGRRVAVLLDAVRPAGTHDVTWDGSGLPPGTYVCRVTTARDRAQAKLTLAR
jgi:hypothetical protein